MSKTLAELAVVISARATEFEKSLNVVNRNLDKTLKKTEALGKKMSLSITAPLVGLGTLAVTSYDKQAKAIAQVEAGLKSTGGQVGLTSQQLQDMAANLQKKTIFGDETILKDATAQLLTFTNIAGTNFERTQVAALDLATRMDGDLKSASIQLGKALNDPVTNLSALSRSGIQFSDSQKETIKTLQETGRLAEAQAIILDELNNQFGGSAEAATAGAGALQQLANSAGDLMEQFGPVILDLLDPLIKSLQEAADEFGNLDADTKKMIVTAAAFAAAVGPVLVVSSKLIQSVNTVSGAVGNMGAKLAKNSTLLAAAPWLAAAAGVAALGYALSQYIDFTDDAEAAQSALNDATKEAAVSTAVERQKVADLASTIEDAATSDEARAAALLKLQQISPAHFKNLSTETSTYVDLRNAVEQYNEQIINTARARVLQKMIEKEVEALEGLKQELTEGPDTFSLENFFGSISGNPAAGYALQTRKVGIAAEESQAKLEALTASLKETNEALEDAGISEGADGFETAKTTFTNLANAADRAQQSVTTLEEVLANTGGNTGGEPNLVNVAPEEEEGLDVEDINADKLDLVTTLRDRMMEVTSTADTMGQSFGSAFGELVTGAASAEQVMKKIAKGMVLQVIKIAKANVIANATSPTNAANIASGGLATPALIVAGLSALEAFIPALAEGGMTMGPTLALIGDNKSGKEAVIPFEKMGPFLNKFGGGGIGGDVRFELEGEKLYGVLKNYESNSNSLT